MFFAEKHREYRLEREQTAGNHFGTVNSAAPPLRARFGADNSDVPPPDNLRAETLDAVANLAAATVADRTGNAYLTSAMANMSAQLRECQAQLVTVLQENSSLRLAASGRNRRGR